jgi:hypothetical protein
MTTVGILICAAAMSYIGYEALKYGSHKETAKEKMIKTIHPVYLPKKPPPKWYAILLGICCWIAAIYAIIQIFLK